MKTTGIAAAACVMWATGLLAQPPAGAPAPVDAPVTVRVLLPDGSPAPGVEVGTILANANEDGPFELGALLHADGKQAPHLTDAAGEIAIRAVSLSFQPEAPKPRVISALSKDHALVGMTEVTAADLGKAVTVKLRPACRVTVKVKSTELEGLGKPLTTTHLYVFRNNVKAAGVEWQHGLHELVLPPSEYLLWVYGTSSSIETPTLTIAEGETSRTIDVDLPASPLTRVIGKEAPELRQIKAWKNGGPVTLAELKGKVVLLDFWGWWCGPCVHSMPELIATYEKYKDRGLVVIAVHDDSIGTIEEMDAKLAWARRDVWGGRDLPFLVALDGGGEVMMERTNATARGATTAAYGVDQFPTQILIGRDGKVIGKRGSGDKDQLGALIDAK